MRYECTVPVMKSVDPQTLSRLGSLGRIFPQLDEKFETLRDFYPHRMLDVFAELLEEGDSRLSLLDCEHFRLSAEKHYLQFIRLCYEANGRKVYLFTKEFSEGDLQNYLQKIKFMDRIDELVYSRQFEIKAGSRLFLIEEPEILETILRGFLRELIQGVLFFPLKPMALLSGYDLSLPLLGEDQEILSQYHNLAKRSGLFFR